MKRKIVIGSRGSRLAMIQTASVVDLLRKANPGLEVTIKQIKTAGDRDRHSRLEALGTDVFVKELEETLLDGRIDIAVHSLKDLPTETPGGLRILAVTARLDPADVLISGKYKLAGLPAGARIGTGSLRRTAQLAACRPDLLACPVRGNIETRLRKVVHHELDAVIMAAAALIRLGWQHKITEYLPLDPFLPAAGQGALAIEARLGDDEVADLVSPVNHWLTWQCISAERAFLKALGGGCRAPIGALATAGNEAINLRAMVASPDGREIRRAAAEEDITAAEKLGGSLAAKMKEMGADKLIKEAGAT